MDIEKFKNDLKHLVDKGSEHRSNLSIVEIGEVLDGYTVVLPEGSSSEIVDILYDVNKSQVLSFLAKKYQDLQCDKKFKDNPWEEMQQREYRDTFEQWYKNLENKEDIYNLISNELDIYIDEDHKKSALEGIQETIEQREQEQREELSSEIEGGVTKDHSIAADHHIIALKQNLAYQEKVPCLDDEMKQKIDRMVMYYLTNDGSYSKPYDDLKDNYKTFILLPIISDILTLSYENTYRITDNTGKDITDLFEQGDLGQQLTLNLPET